MKVDVTKKNRCAKCFVYGYDQDDDEAIVKRPHARRVTTWQGINQSHIFNLPLSIAAAKNSRQIPPWQ